ncbi:MAG: class I SAM-dependent rRNA methyltransferase [Actinomycetia bacterium]|nr:class I SAM-dependent rRNA methyltransferase [Actinomycetes bacterium]
MAERAEDPAPGATDGIHEVRLKPGRHRALEGCPWIFRGELLRHEVPTGSVVQVLDSTGRFVGRGLYSATSAIAVRLLSWTRTVAVDGALVRDRIRRAVEFRRRLYPDRQAMRLVNSEADGLPGLIVDRYGPMLVMQVLAAGLMPFYDDIVEALVEAVDPEGIYERGAVPVRRYEALPLEDRLAWGRWISPVEVEEHGLRLTVDLAEGQKTGHFFDQYENRDRATRNAAGLDVADVFCYTGAFGLLAAARGAASVVGVDSDPDAVGRAEANAAANGLAHRTRFVTANAFDWLRAESAGGPAYDLVILDPPAFTKSRASREAALRGYREINLRALKLVRPGGQLVTSSCSYHVSLDDFIAVVGQAAHDAHRHVRLLAVGGQAPDHPVHPALPESRYLKCLFLAVEE